MATEIDHGGSGWTDQETGITYSASGEALNAPDTGGSSHFDANGQLWYANGEKVDMSAYAPITAPENYPGGFWGYYQHLVDTGQVNNDTQGLGGVAGFLRTHGYLVPLALASGGLALEAAGGFGAASGLGTTAELAGPTYGELGITGIAEGGMGPTYAEMGYTGLNQQAAINAANAAQGTSFADALKTANQVRQGVSTASSLAKLLSPTSSLSGAAGSALSGAAQKLATGQTGVGMAIPSIIRGNQNPFLQTAQQPIRSTSPDLAQLANLLKQG
jgi:hypothetical protein